MTNFVHKLSEDLILCEVGAKAYSLSKMTQAKIRVPSGFVINKKLLVLDDPTSAHLKSLIKKHLEELKSHFVMVRSSAIGEDGDHFSFAGQFDSFQVINDVDAVVSAILKVKESLHSRRSQSYENLKGQKIQEMAIIVQEMIDPDYAGVLFTTSPLTQEGMHLEYVAGHADKLVQGEVTPESIQIDEEVAILKEVPFDLNELIEQAKQILKLYKSKPQDIEWAYKDKVFYFVQSRPITSLKHKIKWSNTNVNENYPNKLSPLLYSIAKQSYYHYYKNLGLALGVIKKNNSDLEKYFANAIGVFGHRMYYNMSSLHKIIEFTPLSNLMQKSFDDFIGYQKKDNLNHQITASFKKLKSIIKMLYHLLSLEKKVEFIENEVTQYAHQNQGHQDLTQSFSSFHKFLFIRFHLWYNAAFADFFAMLTYGILGKVIENSRIENPVGVQNGLIQGIQGLISNKPLHAMWEIQQQIKNDYKLQALFKKNPETILEELNSHVKYEHLKKMVDQYLDQWGYRCPEELTFLTPNYIENPLAFIQILKSYIESSPENPQKLVDLKHADRVNLLFETISQIKINFRFRPLRKFILPVFLKIFTRLTMFSISCRERVRLKQALMYYTFKTTCLRIAQILVDKKVLNKKQDIFFLEYTEINRFISGEEIDSLYIRDLVNLRKQSLERSKNAPDNFYSFQEDLGMHLYDQDIINSVSNQNLKGLAACPGKIEGRVKVIDNISQINKLIKGDILVTKQTDPGWITVFPIIAGIIVERGGVLSHSAIVAREFGIPAVVGIPQVTSLLKDGARVLLNGDTGEVICLD